MFRGLKVRVVRVIEVKDRNLWLAIGHLVAAEDHFAEHWEVKYLDDTRYIRQCLANFAVTNSPIEEIRTVMDMMDQHISTLINENEDRRKHMWCEIKHLLCAYVCLLEFTSKLVREKREEGKGKDE